MLGGATIFIMPSIMTSCEKDPDGGNNNNPPPPGNKITLDLNNPSYASLKNTGSSLVVQGVIVAKTGSGYVALDSACTHNGCTVGYSSPANNFPCPCHGSVFSPTGSVVTGPATIALKSYAVSLTGDILTISL